MAPILRANNARLFAHTNHSARCQACVSERSNRSLLSWLRPLFTFLIFSWHLMPFLKVTSTHKSPMWANYSVLVTLIRFTQVSNPESNLALFSLSLSHSMYIYIRFSLFPLRSPVFSDNRDFISYPNHGWRPFACLYASNCMNTILPTWRACFCLGVFCSSHDLVSNCALHDML